MATAIFESEERVNCVRMEGLALLKIVKHCHESLPHMVTGSLLGLNVGGGVLEVTSAFPFPADSKVSAPTEDGDDNAGLEGHEFQLEMMRMLREVNVDNNCVGWYQSMYLGIYSTSSLLENQLSYQTDLSPNAVVFLYDPMQTAQGNLVMKCYRLTEECLKIKTSGANVFLEPKNIFEEIPVKLSNPGLVRCLLADITDSARTASAILSEDHGGLYNTGADITFDRLDMSTNPYLEKHLEFLSGWVDDLASEQHKFQYYTRQLARGGNNNNDKRDKKKSKEPDGEGWASSDAPRRMESLLISNQIKSYCDQMDKFTEGGLTKLYIAGGLHDKDTTRSA